MEITEFCPMPNNEQFKLLALTLDAQTHKTTIKLTIAASRKNLLKWMIQQPNWLGLVLHGEQEQQCLTGKVYWKY